MFTVNHKSANKFVRTQNEMGNDVRWDGWSMVFFYPTPYGFDRASKTDKTGVNVRGAFRGGRWGIETSVPVNDEGKWEIPPRSVRFGKRNKGRALVE